ncbi:hypothetical protein BDQ17DRAFT_1184171, partial [Cyathus striatus]
ESHEALRTEWAKAKARKERWSEEVQIIAEEMHRVTDQRSVTDSATQQGLLAYSYKQSALARKLAISCANTWTPLLETHGTLSDW